MIKWFVYMLKNDEEISCIETSDLFEAKAAVFDLITAVGDITIVYQKTAIYECFNLEMDTGEKLCIVISRYNTRNCCKNTTLFNEKSSK